MNAKEILDVLKKRFYLIIIIPLLFAGVTAAYSFLFIPNIYTSSVPLYVWQHNESMDLTDENATVDTSDKSRKSVQGDISFNNMIAKDLQTFLKSNMISKAVMEDLGLSSLSGFTITTDIDSKNSSRVVNIVVKGNNAEAVAQVANSYAKKTSETVTKFINVDAINVLEQAQPSSSPSGPPRNLYITMATGAGLCVALIIILIISYFDSSIKNKKELEKAFKLPVLGQVPYIRRTKSR